MAASNFDRALALVLKSEGGFVNHPADPGGATNLGVTIGTARRLGIDVDGDGDTDVVDIKKLRLSDAAKVYRAEYWNKVRGDDLPSGVDYAVFDFAVNSGPARAIIGLQRAAGVADDSKLGKLTLAAVQMGDPAALTRTLCTARLAFLQKLSTWPTFGKGWAKRIASVQRDALGMAAVPARKLDPLPTSPQAPELTMPQVLPSTLPISTPKPWYLSKGVIGGILAALIPLATPLIPALKLVDPNSAADVLLRVVEVAGPVIGGIMAILGRLSATQPIAGTQAAVQAQDIASAVSSTVATLEPMIAEVRPPSIMDMPLQHVVEQLPAAIAAVQQLGVLAQFQAPQAIQRQG